VKSPDFLSLEKKISRFYLQIFYSLRLAGLQIPGTVPDLAFVRKAKTQIHNPKSFRQMRVMFQCRSLGASYQDGVDVDKKNSVCIEKFTASS
jgi:hypothetical protein